MKTMLSPTALREAAAMQRSLDRLDLIVKALKKLRADDVVYLGVLDGDGEGSYYGNECAGLRNEDVGMTLLGVREILVERLRKLGVDAK